LCLLLLLFVATPAASRDASFVFGDGTCPDPLTLQSEVVRLTPEPRREELFERVRVDVTDGGDTYRVTLITNEDRQDKSFTDPNRDCAKRARFAAVFIVVTLFPPELDLEGNSPGESAPGADSAPDEASVAAPSPTPRRAQESTPSTEGRPASPPESTSEQGSEDELGFDPIARIEVGSEGGLAPRMRDAVGVRKLGAGVLAVLGRGGIRLTLGMGYTFPTRFDAGLVRVRMSELPARVGIRLPWESGSLGVALDLGLSGALRQVRGRDAVEPNEASGVGFGVRADFGVFYALTQRLQLLLGVHATLEPAPAELVALPYGSVGTLPWLWLGARAGFAVAL
jgi:hypothetical protein